MSRLNGSHSEKSTGVGIGDVLGWLLASSWIDRVLIKYVSAIYVPSGRTKFDVEQRYGLEASTVRIGVDSDFYSADDDPGIVDDLDIKGDSVLLAVGKLHRQKNQIACVRAMPAILNRRPNAILLLAGEGPARSELEDEVRRLALDNKVIFLGHRNQAEVRKLYARANLNLFPAINQSWGLTPFEALCAGTISVEALCAGTISVVSNETGASEILLRHDIGYVCDPSPHAIAEAVLDAFKLAKFSESYVEKGKSFVINRLTWSNYAMNVQDIFERVLMESNPWLLDQMAREVGKQ